MSRKINYTDIPTDGLVASYDLDGDALDSSGNGNDGTATNVTYVSAERGYVSEVCSFNGSSSYVNLTGFSLSSSTKTISLLAKQSARDDDYLFDFVTGRYIVTLYSPTRVGSGNVGFYDGGSSWIDLGFASAGLNIWEHYVFVMDGTTLYVYQDNVLKSTKTINNNNLGGNIAIGSQNPGSPALFFNGTIGLFRIYNRALSQQEINNIYQEGQRKLGPTNLIGNNGDFQKYSLPNLETGKVLEISKPANGGVYYDQSGNGNNGTATDVTDTTLGLNNVMGFNGTSSYVDTNYNLTGADSTIIFSYKHTESGTDDFIFSQGYKTNADGRNGLKINIDNTMQLFQNPGGVIIINTIALTVGKTYRIAIVRTNIDKWEIFINGISAGSDTGGIAMPNESILFMLLISGYQAGELIQPIIYNRALLQKEIQQDYYSNFIN